MKLCLGLVVLSSCCCFWPSSSELPPSPYTQMCERDCWASPEREPARLEPEVLCVEWMCRPRFVIEGPREVHVEVNGNVREMPVALERWTGPLVLQLYTVWGQVARCSVEVGPETERLQVDFDSKEKVWVVAEGWGGNRWSCTTVGNSSFAMGAVQTVDADAVDEGIDRAWRALPRARAADDLQVTAWLISKGVLPEGTRLWRRTPEGRVGDGGAVVVRDISFEGLGHVDEHGVRVCDETWCDGSYEWTGPLSTRGRTAFVGEGKARICRAWDEHPGGMIAVQLDDRWAETWPVRGECTGGQDFVRTLPLVPFDAPPERDPAPPPRPDDPVQPSARAVPAEVDSIAQLGAWFAAVEPDPRLRVEAVHDWVATHIRYDGVAYHSGIFPSQDAEDVFRTRTGVCAGYANLAAALGTAAGVEIVYVSGWVRTEGGLEGHAWNAARIEGTWHLFDATWDAGSLAGDTFVPSYSQDWLFVPSEVFLATHHPRDEDWQLVPSPEPESDFVARMPLTGGATLLSPATGQVQTSASEIEVRVAGKGMGGEVHAMGSEQIAPCVPEGERPTTLRCPLPAAGTWAVDLLSDDSLVGQVVVVRQ